MHDRATLDDAPLHLFGWDGDPPPPTHTRTSRSTPDPLRVVESALLFPFVCRCGFLLCVWGVGVTALVFRFGFDSSLALNREPVVYSVGDADAASSMTLPLVSSLPRFASPRLVDVVARVTVEREALSTHRQPQRWRLEVGDDVQRWRCCALLCSAVLCCVLCVFLLGARVIRTQQFLQFSLAHLPPHDASALIDSPIILRVPFCVAHLFFIF